MTVWVLVVSSFLAAGGEQPSLEGQARQLRLGTFVFPTREACEAAREGAKEFAQTGNQRLLVGECLEEVR